MTLFYIIDTSESMRESRIGIVNGAMEISVYRLLWRMEE
jgi:Mg-chelatase subunit ChlD